MLRPLLITEGPLKLGTSAAHEYEMLNVELIKHLLLELLKKLKFRITFYNSCPLKNII